MPLKGFATFLSGSFKNRNLEHLTPTVGESHVADWPARGTSELTERIAQWGQRCGLDVGQVEPHVLLYMDGSRGLLGGHFPMAAKLKIKLWP
jgi:hypothetical protein